MHVVQVTSGLDFMIPQRTDRPVSTVILLLAHVPMRRLRTSKDKTANDQSREHRRGHHTAPIQADDGTRVDIVEDEVRRIADHNPES